MSLKSILFIGSFPPPITGQSFAFEKCYLYYSGTKFKIDRTPIGSGIFLKAFSHFIVALKVLYALVFKKIDKIYMTCFSTIEGSASDILVMLLCYSFRKRVIVHLHGSNFSSVILGAPKPYRWILIRLYKRVDLAIVLLEKMREQFEFLLPLDKIAVVTNFYDPVLESVSPDFRQTKQFSKRIKIGYLSNLIYSKGILHLIQALEVLLAEGLAVDLYIAGKYMSDDHLSAEKIQHLFEAKLAEYPEIKYYGVIGGEEKLNFYKSIDIFALPTFYLHEAQPLSIIEAMRTGCVIISTNYKYIPNLVSSKNGFLIEPRSVEALVEPIRYILKNPASFEEIQVYNIRIAMEEYSLDNYLNKLFAILQED